MGRNGPYGSSGRSQAGCLRQAMRALTRASRRFPDTVRIRSLSEFFRQVLGLQMVVPRRHGQRLVAGYTNGFMRWQAAGDKMMVGETGVEPAWLAPRHFKCLVYTNSTTRPLTISAQISKANSLR